SSLEFQVFALDTLPGLKCLVKGQIDGIGTRAHICGAKQHVRFGQQRTSSYRPLRPGGILPLTPNSSDLVPKAADANPSAERPRFKSSRIAAARLGMRVL